MMITFSNITLTADGGDMHTYLACGTPGEEEIEFSDRFREFKGEHERAHEIDVQVQPYCYGEGDKTLRRADREHLALISMMEDFPKQLTVIPLMTRHYVLDGLSA